MAIKKQKRLASGAVGDYWKIINLHLDRTAKSCSYHIALYLSETEGKASKPHLGTVKTYIFQLTNEEMCSDLVETGYTKIKSKAAEMIDPIFGSSQFVGPAQPFDADLAEGEDV